MELIFQTFFCILWLCPLACIIALESIGLPYPVKLRLVAAAMIAGTSGSFDIASVILCFVSAGAIVGDNIGYFLP